MDKGWWKLTLAAVLLFTSAYAEATFSNHMKDFIRAVEQIEDEDPGLGPGDVLKMLRKAAGLNDAFIQYFLPDAEASGSELPAKLSEYLRKAVHHKVLTDTKEEGVVLTPDGSTVALGPLLLGIEAGLLSKTRGEAPGLYQLTLAKDLGLSLRHGSSGTNLFGPDGFWDSLTSPQVFTLSDKPTLLTTAQVNGGMDGIILGKEVSANPSLLVKLSSLLNEYYNHQLDRRGMDGAPRLISQRRRENFKALLLPHLLANQAVESMVLQQRLAGQPRMEVQTKQQLMATVEEGLKEFVHTYVVCPPIVSRASWGAAPYKGTPTQLSLPLTYLFIHHTDTPSEPCLTFDKCAADMRSMQRYHQQDKDWADIGYSFVVGGDGNIYEGRGWNWQGAHTYGYNSKGYGVSFIGNFQSRLPSTHSMDLVRNQLASCAVSGKRLVSSYIIKGHRDMVSTACPGDAFYQEIRRWDHYV
ncbi:PREDICTED: N-acetylmuramoyl-L-alanine amidase-like [Cyprinodon variegatus]|uniref:N-acetylmuramoyl-L-alanine amidase-like n=1 Tax=Cyprinodon variegatus TaxID=28743 RepID=UPI0007428392|nr:PREDICTED: N-acetylmuramoyl-L-alanine amidase-like [Cyprinodon variegatus]